MRFLWQCRPPAGVFPQMRKQNEEVVVVVVMACGVGTEHRTVKCISLLILSCSVNKEFDILSCDNDINDQTMLLSVCLGG